MGKRWLGLGTILFLTMHLAATGCSSGCDKTVAGNVAANSFDNCLVAMPGTQGDKCGLSPTILVDNNCKEDFVRTSGVLVKAGQKGRAFGFDDKPTMSGSLYQILGTIGGKGASVSWTIVDAPKP